MASQANQVRSGHNGQGIMCGSWYPSIFIVRLVFAVIGGSMLMQPEGNVAAQEVPVEARVRETDSTSPILNHGTNPNRSRSDALHESDESFHESLQSANPKKSVIGSAVKSIKPEQIFIGVTVSAILAAIGTIAAGAFISESESEDGHSQAKKVDDDGQGSGSQ